MDATADQSIPVAISARHVHLTAPHIDELFGSGHPLHTRKALSQPGEFAADETVTLVGPKGSIAHVRVVGPAREDDQVEISRTDEMTLGLDAPVRVSGDLNQTPGIKLVGPAGQITLAHGVVLAQRHVHMTPEDAQRLGVRDRQIVEVMIHSPHRSLIFGDVVVRVSAHYALELHLDTDEGNAAGVQPGDRARLLLRSMSGFPES
jgi:acetate kinase